MQSRLRSAVLMLSLIASTALAAIHEQELEAEAKKLLPTLFSKCGQDYYSKWTDSKAKDSSYMITQYKGIAPIFQPYHLFPGDETFKVRY